jgi:DNA-binding transcriptional MerR regulator
VDGYSISQTAERTGFTASALRFYEREGLVRPVRTPAGYRSYTEADVGALRFIARAKSLGLALDQVAELVPLFRAERCAPVQERLRELVDGKIGEARARVADLNGFTSELRRAAGSLGAHTPDGPCDDACGCATDASAGDPPIACTLGDDERQGRAAAWRAQPAARRRPRGSASASTGGRTWARWPRSPPPRTTAAAG